MKTNDTAPRITHVTENTGDSQSFSITDANFDPRAIRCIPMLFQPREHIDEFRVVAVNGDPHAFVVEYKGDMVALNFWRQDRKGNIKLTTTLHANAGRLPDVVLSALPDLEQCATIGLAKYGLCDLMTSFRLMGGEKL